MSTTPCIEKQDTPQDIEPFGYLWPREGGRNGFYFVAPADFEHVEERFRQFYTPVYDKVSAERVTELAKAREHIAVLESMRPHWAQGYTSDGVAAQVTAGALNTLWGLLGASNQTEAVENLRNLPALPCKHFPKADDVCLVCNPHKMPGR